MSESKVENNKNNSLIMLLSLLTLLVGIFLFYYFSEVRLFYRVVGIMFTIILATSIAYQTDFGKTVFSYVSDSKVELKKVTWPTKQETTQTTLGVVVIVVIIGLILWLLDMLFAWSVGTLYGVR
ncbi:MAG: preprotein translocase subunit SecE [Gammaproteobacteria bacterium]|nr:preprotein translocase subunit SecE [Gammaproteobacteria bacterium]|tara:strand:- start:18530 stop:18901 length:372 start_codon:yes stop_codon:yes gene_type:complete